MVPKDSSKSLKKMKNHLDFENDPGKAVFINLDKEAH
jgi:hypothetical protein